MRPIRVMVIVALLSTAQVALAGEPTMGAGDYVPIVPIPNPGGAGGSDLATQGSLATYINALFSIAIAAGAALAAIYIAIGGIEYIFSEAMANKQDGKTRILHALYGLAILLLVTVILFVIGGADAIDLKLFEQRP